MNIFINYTTWIYILLLSCLTIEVLTQNFEYTLEPWDINSIEILREKRDISDNFRIKISQRNQDGQVGLNHQHTNNSFIASARGCPTQNFDQCSKNCECNVGGEAKPEATIPFGRHASQVPDGCGGCKRNYPLPECYTNDSGYMCCNKALENAMHKAYDEMKQTRCNKWNNNNIQSLSNAVQKKAQGCCGGQKFEVITGLGDFAAKIQFHGNNVCKIKRDCRVILVFATPQPPPPPPPPQPQPQYVVAPPPQPQYATAPQQSQYATAEQYNVYGSQIHNRPPYAEPLPLSSYVQPQHRNYVWRV